MSSIRCPYCQHEIGIKGARPGKFHPACPMCHERFNLVVPAEAAAAPKVTPIPHPPADTEAAIAAVAGPLPAAVSKPHASSSAASVAAPAVAMHATATIPPPPAPAPPPVAARDETASAPPPGATAPPQPPGGRNTVAVGLSRQTVQELTKPSTPPAAPEAPEIRGRLGGYDVIQRLGQGGMGAVYLARQLSLDRNVALKTLWPQLASDPQFVSRFTREAYAAAQLSHHNVVQIHDIGVDRSAGGDDTNYFSMEFVEGRTLADLVKETGKLDPEAAVGYVLQAARGLKFAHDHGLIHRDVKPENLLLNEQGVVKVADLGLVKRAGVAESAIGGVSPATAAASPATTQTSISMGTPAYMPPEQARDAATVDARADVYSLGCTLYDLLTGHPPFTGRTAAEVITKHSNEPAVPPDRLERHVPGALSVIVMKMMAKRPEDRYQTMSEVIGSLEGWLGIESGKPFSPKQEHAGILELAAERFNDSRWNRIRTWTIRGFFALCLAAVLLLALPAVGHPFIAAGMVGFVLATVLIYQLVYGIARRTFLLRKVRQLAFGSSITDWLTYLAVAGVTLLLIIAFNLQWIWLGFAVAAALVALGFFFTVDLMLARGREKPLQHAERLLKDMRLRGLDENSLRQFVCKYSGRKWEEFYEALFGYEAKLVARRAWGQGERGRDRPKFAAWREPIIGWIDHKMRRRQQLREQKLLAKLEARALKAKGYDELLAAKQARKNAERFVEKAAMMHESAALRAAETALPTKAAAAIAKPSLKIVQPDWLHEDAHEDEHGETRRHESYLRRRYGTPIDVVFGRGVRIIAALLLLAGFAFWWNANSGEEARKQASDLMGTREEVTITASQKQLTQAVKAYKDFDVQVKGRQPLHVKYVPDWIAEAVGTWNGGLAGVLLLIGVFFAGRLLGLTMLLAAALALFGERLHVPILAGHAWAAAIAGIVIWFLGITFFRRTAG